MTAVNIEIGPNVVAALALICSAVTAYLQQKTRKELKPNGGTSMRDAVDRIEHHAEQIANAAAIAPTAAADQPSSTERVNDAWRKATGGDQ